MRYFSFALQMALFAGMIVAIFFFFQIIRAFATDKSPPEVEATVTRVIDGDSMMVSAVVWINQTVVTEVRLDGVDTPEKGGKAKCPKERAAADEATKWLRTLIEGQTVTLIGLVDDKFGGRVRARVKFGQMDVNAELIKAGYARPYHGEKREGWCP